MSDTLLLNASFEPIKIISWQKAITLFFRGKVEVVTEYDKEVRSVSIALKIPSVVRLTRYINLRGNNLPLTKLNLLTRDSFMCQYCGTSLNKTSATLDHVVPRSRGGQRTWNNIVSACQSCNRKKGAKTPREAHMPLINEPFEPSWLPVFEVRIKGKIPLDWNAFSKKHSR